MSTPQPNSFSKTLAEPRFENITVTPADAEAWLEVNFNNRPKTTAKIREMARDMRNGRFLLNGETIKFSPDGNLLDGQHRLEALIISGVPIRLSVAYDVQDESQLTMDTGTKRNVAGALFFRGVAVDRTFAQAISAGMLMYNSASAARPTGSEQVNFVENHLDDIAWAIGVSGEAARKLGSKKLLGTAAIILGQVSKPQAEIFFRSLGTGEMLMIGNPILTLRNKLLAEKLQVTHRADLINYLGLIFKSWNAWRLGKQVRVLRFGENEVFPEPK